MKHIVCFSGGEGSAIVGIEVAKRYGPENTIFLNHDINGRVEDTLIKQYKIDVANYAGVPITYANMPGWETKDQIDVCVEAKAFKVGVHPLCTNRMKTAPFHKWLHEKYPVQKGAKRDDVIIYYGFESKENERIKRRTGVLAGMGYMTDYPLATWEGVIKSTSEVGISPPSTYEVWKHANCSGCLRAGRQHWYVTYCLRPDMYEKAKDGERIIKHSILKGIFLKDLEPKFEIMKNAGVPAHEKQAAATFWAMVKKQFGKNFMKEDTEEVVCEMFDDKGQMDLYEFVS